MTGREYVCAWCGDKCLSSWTEAEARAEYEHTFGQSLDETAVQLCDDCYQASFRDRDELQRRRK